MAEDGRWQQLRALFSAELDERVQALGALLLRLERGEGEGPERAALFDALLREAHSLKGAARAVEEADVERLAHALEGLLAGARAAAAPLAQDWVAELARAVAALDALAQSGGGAAVNLDEVIAGLASVSAAPPDGAPPPPAASADAPPTSASPPAAPPATAVPVAPPAAAPPPRPSPPAAPAPRPASAEPPPSGPTAAAHAGSAGPPRGAAESVRVAVGKLDLLLAQAGELAVTQSRIERRLTELQGLREDLDLWRREWRAARALRSGLSPRTGADSRARGRELETLMRFVEGADQRVGAALQRVEALTTELRRDAAELRVVTRAIGDEVMAVRLTPVSTLFGPLERMARDLSRTLGKEIALEFSGEDTELDRKVLEQLRDPLMHMLRNALDHGIEPPAERTAQGKPRAGTLRLAASLRGGQVEVDVEDDGAGLDAARLRRVAVERKLLSEEQAAALDDHAARELIFLPGLSTSASVSDVSGRGVGMDVVREHVERLGGRIDVASRPGQGTRFVIRVPLTLATVRAILLEQDGQVFAVPAAMVQRSARLQEQQIVWLEGRRAIALDGHPVPVVELADVLERPRPAVRSPRAWRPYFVLGQSGRQVALLTEQLLGEQEIVIKSLGWPLRRVRNVSGAAVLGSGHTAVILNPSDLLRSAFRLFGAAGRCEAPPSDTQAPAARRKRLLVVDDSLTTRTLVRSILEAAGYDVVVASDGVEALAALRGSVVDLVVSDLDMPRMDGFDLTAEIRRDADLRRIPVVLVTSLESREHRERGVAVGADAYITKGGFDQRHLLETVGRLL